MRGINRVVIAGNLGADPAVKNFNNGGKVVNLSIATQEYWIDKNSGEQKKSVEWHRVSLYDGLANAAERFLKKGSAVYIEAKLKTRKYKDEDGNDKYITEIRGYDLQMLDSNKKENDNSNASTAQNKPEEDAFDDGFDDGFDDNKQEQETESNEKVDGQTEYKEGEEKLETTKKEDAVDSNEEVDVDDILDDF